MLSHLGALVSGDRSQQIRWKIAHSLDQCLPKGLAITTRIALLWFV
ncbi:hypothetical protein [Rhodococcus sp. ACPA4]